MRGSTRRGSGTSDSGDDDRRATVLLGDAGMREDVMGGMGDAFSFGEEVSQ